MVIHVAIQCNANDVGTYCASSSNGSYSGKGGGYDGDGNDSVEVLLPTPCVTGDICMMAS